MARYVVDCGVVLSTSPTSWAETYDAEYLALTQLQADAVTHV